MSYTNLLYHIVFATKDRKPFISREFRPRLHEYLAGTVRGLGGFALEINGVADHVHLLVRLKPALSLSDFLSKLKANSSAWARKETRGWLGWQSRYGAFTVSQSQIDRVRRYVRNQEQHHRRTSFEKEFRLLLKAHGIEFDENYPWN
jgi:putative transposase